LKISAKNAVFLVLSGKTNFTTFGPLEKLLEKSTSSPRGKYLSDARAHKHVKLHNFCKKIYCVTPSGNNVQQHQCGKQSIAV